MTEVLIPSGKTHVGSDELYADVIGAVTAEISY